MAYNILFFPASHFFNQVINVLLEDLERRPLFSVQVPQNAPQQSREADPVSELMVQLKGAMVEKMKSSLFQAVISYWAVADTKQEAESKLANIQAVLTELNQKNMNTLKHRLLFTRQVEELNRTGELQNIVSMKPVLEMKRKFLPFVQYENNGQIIFDSELYSLWHLPNTTSATVSSIKMTKYRKLPATQRMRESSEDFFVKLGSSDFRAQEASPVGISTWDDMKKHIYILGGTGAGKSETLKTIISSLLHKEGEEKTACLIVDPKNDFATDLLTMIPESRRDDVVYFNPSRQKERPLSFPFFSKFSGEKEGEERIEFIISVMKRFVQIDSEYSWGPELENILRNLFATAYLLPEQSLSGLDMLLHEPTHIKNILRYLPSRLQQFWTGSILKRNDNDLARYLATTNNKLGKFLDYPEFMNIADRFDTKITFEEMIASGKIFIANFGSSSEQMKKYYSVYLTAHIASAIFASAQISSEKRKPAVFVVDEFQRVASDIFETLFSEVRAFNTALVVSNQFMGQLSERIQKSIESNIATKIFMRTQSMSDAAIAQTILGEKATAEDIINLPTGAAYLKTLVHGIPQDPMSIRIDKTEHPTEVSKESEEYFIRHTMEQYGTPLDVIRQKRETVNSAYYTSEKEQVFFEHMGKRKTFEPAQTNEMPISSSPQPVSAVVTSGLEKTLFDYSS